MRGAPQRGIRRGHAPDQSPERGVDGRATSGRAAREKRPVRAKATPLPPQDSVRSHDDEGQLPPAPDAGQRDPEEAITSAERWPGHRSFVHSELLTQGQILEGKLAVAAQEEGEKPKQMEYVRRSPSWSTGGGTQSSLSGSQLTPAQKNQAELPFTFAYIATSPLALRVRHETPP